jgi:hypothetical protein
MWAWLGAIPHWLYFTPLRKSGATWSRVVIWSSGIATASAIIGLVIGVWMYSPAKRYRYAGAPTSIPYRRQKRWHTILGLVFGAGAITWALSGFLSMEPFPLSSQEEVAGASIPQVLRGRMRFADFAGKDPRTALREAGPGPVAELEFTAFAGEPMYLATLGSGATHIVPVEGRPMVEFDRARIMDLVRRAAGTTGVAELRVLTEYDRYYLDRRRQRPLPVILARLNDAQQTRYYIDPKTARVAGGYRSGDWMERWLYHGLHSLDFPWLYRYRPLWDIVVITFLAGGTALCVTSLILAWRVLGRRLRVLVSERRELPATEDLA